MIQNLKYAPRDYIVHASAIPGHCEKAVAYVYTSTLAYHIKDE